MIDRIKTAAALSLLLAALAVAAGQVTKGEPAFNATDVTNSLDFVNHQPVPPNAYRVLFIGDSLTLHEPSPGLGDHFQGMAASRPENDFVHLAAAHMQAKLGERPVEVFYDNGGKGKIGPMLAYEQRMPSIAPELIVPQGGENDPFDNAFRAMYRALLHAAHPPVTRMIVLGDWNSREKSAFEQAEAAAAGLPFIGLTTLHAVAANSGDGSRYEVRGVAMHPNDRDLRVIADAIDRAFNGFPAATPKPVRGNGRTASSWATKSAHN